MRASRQELTVQSLRIAAMVIALIWLRSYTTFPFGVALIFAVAIGWGAMALGLYIHRTYQENQRYRRDGN